MPPRGVDRASLGPWPPMTVAAGLAHVPGATAPGGWCGVEKPPGGWGGVDPARAEQPRITRITRE